MNDHNSTQQVNMQQQNIPQAGANAQGVRQPNMQQAGVQSNASPYMQQAGAQPNTPSNMQQPNAQPNVQPNTSPYIQQPNMQQPMYPQDRIYMQQFAPQPYAVAKKPDTQQTQNLKGNFGILGLASLLYACFYALCMYRNGSGITYPFFLAGSLWYYCFCMKKLGISLRKDSIFYMASILLLGLSTFCTADGKIIAMNKTGIWVLTISFLLHQFYNDKNWTFGRYTGYVITALFGSLGEIARPFLDLAGYRKIRGKKEKGILLYVSIGLCFSIPLLAVVWLLLMSADRVFYNMTVSVVDKLDIGNVLGILGTIFLMFLMSYCIMAYLCKKTFSEERWQRVQMNAMIAITVILPVTLLYLVFCGVQIVCLFLGKIDLTKYSYAEYARQGFFQLLLICILNLVLVLVGHAYFRENKWLKGMLTVMSLCTYIMIASSAFRMILYIKHYYLTFLRVFVLWSLVVLFILLTGVIVSIFAKSFPLFKYSMIVVTVCYLLLSLAHPDYWIAKCNVANMGEHVNDFFDADAYQDYGYLSRLSADAAPAFAEYFAEEGFTMDYAVKGSEERAVKEVVGGYYFDSYYELYGGWRSDEQSWGYYYLKSIYDTYDRMGIRSFNLSKYIAYQTLK